MTRAWKRIDDSLNRLLRRFAVALLGDDGAPLPATLDSTGIAALDDALGGGLPRGRVVEVFGSPGSGKTALALALVRACQARGGVAVWIDAERALDGARAHAAGIDLDRLVVMRPSSGEQAFAAIDMLVARGRVQLVVIDSIAALVPDAELHAPVGTAPAGLHARLMSASLRRVHGALFDAGCTLVCVNQTRTSFDEGGAAVQGTTGGQALLFYAAARLEVRGGAGGGVLVRKCDRTGAAAPGQGWRAPDPSAHDPTDRAPGTPHGIHPTT
jgi:recombination protein RecA